MHLRHRLVFTLLFVFTSYLPLWAEEAPRSRQAVVAADLPDEAMIQLSSWLAASETRTLFLMDSPFTAPPNRDLLRRIQPNGIVAIGPHTNAQAEVEERLGQKLSSFVEWNKNPPAELRRRLFPRMNQIVVCPATPRRLLLQGAWLAGVMHAPLFVSRNGDDADELRRWLGEGEVRGLVAIGSTRGMCRGLLASVEATEPGKEPVRSAVQLEEMMGEAAVTHAGRARLRKSSTIRTVVVSNPADVSSGLGRMSQLAPWVAASKGAALLLTNDKGDDTATIVGDALTTPDLRQLDSLLLLAGLKAIPTERRPNPVKGKDEEIEMEPLTPRGTETFSLATGRLFHDNPGMVLVQLGRALVLPANGKPRHVLVVSNPGGGLPLLETFSRHTANELRNAGYQTSSMFGKDADKDKMRKLLPEQDLFLWEGHYRTLIDDFGFLTWTERLPPALYFLQSCLALKEEEASPLMQRGAFAVVGSSTRTYSGTGGAFSVAFFDATAYENQTLGGALRQAKNYLVCYSLLKEKRLGAKAKLTGVSVRSAWAFTLWGDPTLHLPRPATPEKALPAVHHEVHGNTIVFTLPEQSYEPVKVGDYNATMLPNARLAGLLTLGAEENEKHLVPFVFAEVALPKAPAGKKPQLTTKLSDKSYVFNWDERRKVGYLLVTPRTKDQREIRFKVDWVD